MSSIDPVAAAAHSRSSTPANKGSNAEFLARMQAAPPAQSLPAGSGDTHFQNAAYDNQHGPATSADNSGTNAGQWQGGPVAARLFADTLGDSTAALHPSGLRSPANSALPGSRLYGLGAQATYHLSYLGKATLPVTGEADKAQATATSSETSVANMAPAPVAALAPGSGNTSGIFASPLPAYAATPETEFSGSAAAIAYASARSPWQERQIRLHERDGVLEVTLRDYHMSAQETAGLLTALHAQAGQQGRTLQRITLNGQIIWQLQS